MRKLRLCFVLAVIAFLSFGLTTCALWGNSEYKFIWSCNYANYIDVYPSSGGSPGYFRLSSANRSVTVLWTGEGEDFFGGYSATSNYPSNRTAPWSRRYDALKQVVFYDY